MAPDTILAWYHKLVAMKWDYSRLRGPGRPRLTDDIRRLVVRLALENRRWGYERIQGVMKELGHTIAVTSVRNIIKENGIEPAPERSRHGDWSTFLKSHWKSIAAADFFTVEVCTWRGLVTHYALFFIDLATRRVHLGGITTNPNTAWMMQVAKNVTDPFDGFLQDKKFLIIDRDTKYCEAFRHLRKTAGVEPIRLPPKSPNLNAYAERFVRSIDQGRMPRSDDLLRRDLTTKCQRRVSGALSPRTAASRSRESLSREQWGTSRRRHTRRMSRATRRTSAFISPLGSVALFFG